jgi:hypothetical protein
MYAKLEQLRPQLAGALGDDGALSERIERIVRGAFAFARAHQIEGRLLLRQVITAGELDEPRRTASQVPFLAEASALLATRLGRPATALRLPLQSIVVLVSRFAASSDRELELFTGLEAPAAIAAVEDHLVRTAHALLLEVHHG